MKTNESKELEIDILPMKEAQLKPATIRPPCPCKSMVIIKRCQFDNEDLFKSMTSGKPCVLSDDNLIGMTKASEAPSNVIRISLAFR